MKFKTLAYCLIFQMLVQPIAFMPSSMAQGVKRIGVIDMEAGGISDAERLTALGVVKDRLAKETNVAVVKDEEIDQLLIEKNPLRDQVERLRLEHQSRLTDLKAQFEEAQRFYQASQFEEAIAVLDTAFASLKSAALVMDPSLPAEILKLSAACHFFVGSEPNAKKSFATLLDLDSEALLSAQKFPPALQDLFKKTHGEKREERKVWAAQSSVQGIRANILGYPVEFIESDRILFKLPLDHPILKNQTLVIEKEGFVPLLISLDSLPQALNWQSTRDARRSTKGLFGPVGSQSPHPELKSLIEGLHLSLTFLGTLTRDASGQFTMKGQLLEDPTGRTTPVIQNMGAQSKDVIYNVVGELMRYVSPEGIIITAPVVTKPLPRPVATEIHKGFQTPAAMPSVEAEDPHPFYKTWWFWTLVGVGVAGGGVGAYMLLKPEEKLKFEVAGPG